MRNFIKSIGLLLFLAFGLVFGAIVHATTNPITQEKILTIDDPLAFDRIGMSIAMDGDTAIIGGAGGNRGGAYVFTRDSTGVWHQQQTLVSTTYAGGRIGSAVALDGDTAMVGADTYWTPYKGGGLVYVFKRDSAGVWSQHQILIPNDTSAGYPRGDHFGYSIALDGNTVVIGANEDNVDSYSMARLGSAYVFEYNSATGLWTEKQELIASDRNPSDFFGSSVALDGDIAAIGAPGKESLTGAVYVFERDGTGAWTQTEQHKLVAGGLAGYTHFGHSVGMVGDTIIAGAKSDGDPYANYGTAYVFTRDDMGDWTEQQELRASDWGPYSVHQFGTSLAMEGNTVVIGAPLTMHSGVWQAGAAYLFTESSGTWTEQAKLIASDPATKDYLGSTERLTPGAIGISGSTIMVGAPLRDTGGSTDSGAAYVFSYITNTPPVAEAGENQSVHVGETVYLNGGGSYDEETASEDLLYSWEFESIPSGSAVSLVGADTMEPLFETDAVGDYVVTLTVTDEGDLSCAPDTVIVSTFNTPPNAVAGEDQSVLAGTLVELNGAGSEDPDDDLLSYDWIISQMPEGSSAVLSDADTPYPTLQTDIPGAYEMTLVVNDGYVDSDPALVTVLAIALDDYVCARMGESVNLVADMPKDSFTTKGNKKALSNFLRLGCEKTQGEEIEEALHKLEQAMSRTDGCILRGEVDQAGGGAGPKKDFVIDCMDQSQLYPLILEAIEAVDP